MNAKIIVADIDNTLIAKYQDMSAYERNIINEARSKGFLFGIASGRNLSRCQWMCKQWGIEVDFYICVNGYELYDCKEQKSYLGELMKPSWCQEAIELLLPYDPVITMPAGDKAYVNRIDNYYAKMGNAYHYNHVIVDSLDFFLQPCKKLSFRMEDDQIEAVDEAILSHPFQDFMLFHTQYNLLETCPKSVSKGNALQKYCALKNIPIDHVVAFGDTQNDEDMLAMAGLGVCVANGDDSTKAIADIVSEYDCEHDAVAHFIEDHLWLR